MKPRYEYSKLGNFFYKLCGKGTEFLVKRKFLFYVLSLTWGLPLTLIGLITSLVLLPFVKPTKFCWAYCFKLIENWGGLEMGLMFLRDTTSTDSLSNHEYGHSFQNCILGPFFIFLVWIPSAIRYWIRRVKKTDKPYDAVWFEGSATDCGYYAHGEFVKEKLGI